MRCSLVPLSNFPTIQRSYLNVRRGARRVGVLDKYDKRAAQPAASVSPPQLLKRVRLPIQTRLNQNLRPDFLALKITNNRLGRFQPQLVRKLNWIGNDLSFFDCLLALRLPVKPD